MNKKTTMPDLAWISPKRYLCDVLEDMRNSIKMLAIYRIPPLIEEAQTLAGRMEGALEDQKSIEILDRDVHRLKAARRALKKEVQTLIDKRDALETLSKGDVSENG